MRAHSLFATLLVMVAAPAIFGQSPSALTLGGDYAFVHDPSVAKEGSTYYVFSTTVAAP